MQFYFFATRAAIHSRINSAMAARMPDCPQDKSLAMISASLRTRAPIQIAKSRISRVSAQTNVTATAASVPGFGSGCGETPDNLVHPLAAEVVLVCDLSQRLAIVAHLGNFAVALALVLGTWLERAPVPARDLIKGRLLVFRELARLVALPHIANPGSEMDGLAINDLDVVSRY